MLSSLCLQGNISDLDTSNFVQSLFQAAMDCIDVPLECQSLRRELRLELREDRGDRHFPAPELNRQLTRMVVKPLLGADAEGTGVATLALVSAAHRPESQGCS